jgi:peptide/nickel transport system permease protein
MPKFVLLWTDAALWLLVAALVAYVVMVRRRPNLRANWRRVFAHAPALASSIVLLACLIITLLDSVHYRPLLAAVKTDQGSQSAEAYDTRTESLLDGMLQPLIDGRELTYSVPLAYQRFTKDSVEVNGTMQRMAPRLVYGGAHLQNPKTQWLSDVLSRAALGLLVGLVVAAHLSWGLMLWVSGASGVSTRQAWRAARAGDTNIPWHVAVYTLLIVVALAGALTLLATRYHALGTDVTGNDVLYQTLKSIRTAFVIGSLATLATLPLAVVLGIAAGYLRGWWDEAIQYLYTVMSSIPNILLIAACVLMVNVFLDKNPGLFATGLERADLKLFLLCLVLGLTGWAGLCRLLRGETMKLRELEYVQAAQAFGVGNGQIMRRHIFPNVAHLMLIVTVLEFSSLILYEAVLSYVGVGVDPSMNSFGGMINYARNEMSRNPVVWWPFASAFFFMVAMVLAANLFADGVRDAFDPRARVFRARRVVPKASGAAAATSAT